MYIPTHFEVTDQEAIHTFVRANAFGQLVSQVKGQLFATHLPFLPDAEVSRLTCHLARQNPQWQDIDGQEVMVVLQGPHAYVSPSWYKSAGVPTWNYQAVHIFGVASTYLEPERLKLTVDALTKKYEATFAEPWTPDYGESMLNGIVGVDISIAKTECQFKLGQNRSQHDCDSVARELEALRQEDIASAMRTAKK